MSGELPPAGWYPDPEQPGQQRYWDGSTWTEQRQPAAFTAPPPPPAGFSPPPTTGYAPPGYGAPGVQAGYGVAMGPPPDNYLVWAILSTLFCCLPAGIVSIVKSTQVNNKWNSGDTAGAVEASRQAKQWAIISAVVGLIAIVVYIGVIAGSGDFD